MSRLPITIATWDYDRVRALIDGRVQVEGCDVNYITMPVEECFERAYFHGEFEVAEIGFSPYLIALSRGTPPYVAVPAFLSRMFRHSAVYIRTDRGIEGPGRPARQARRRAGISDVGGDVVPRLPAGRVRHRREGHQLGAGRPRELPAGGTSSRSTCPKAFRCGSRQRGDAVGDAGRRPLDAVMSARRPSCFVDGHPKVRRLVPGLSRRRARLLPEIGHVSRSCTRSASGATFSRSNRWLAASVYKAFLQAKRLADAEFAETTALKIGLPWVNGRVRGDAGRDGRGFLVLRRQRANHKTLSTMARYSYEQGLAVRLLTVEEMFAEGNLGETKV